MTPELARAVQISQEKIHTLADFWPLAGPLLDRPVEDAKARERWLGEQGLRDARARARRSWPSSRASSSPAWKPRWKGSSSVKV